MKNLAPVIIFNYNRPDHSMRTWEALSRNELAAETELYLYCDGPKENASDEMREKINKLHEQAKQYAINAPKRGKFKAVHVVCAEQNKGLANSIIGGVTDVINRFGRVIVLEDDLLTSPTFITYMNDALDFYEKLDAVFSISSDTPLNMSSVESYEYDVFASLRFMSYGWGTWKNRWDKVDWSLDYLEELLRHPEQIKAFNRGGDDLTDLLCMQRDGKIDSWAIRFQANHFLQHAISIMPTLPFIHHIGMDGSGTHCGNDIEEDTRTINTSSSFNFIKCIYEDSRTINAFYNSYCRVRRPLWQKVVNTIYRNFGKQVPFVIKMKVYE